VLLFRSLIVLLCLVSGVLLVAACAEEAKPPSVRLVVVAAEGPVEAAAVARVEAALQAAGLAADVERPRSRPDRLPEANKPTILLVEMDGSAAGTWLKLAGGTEWPAAEGYLVRPLPAEGGKSPSVAVLARDARGLLYGAQLVVDEIARVKGVPADLRAEAAPRFSYRAWETQLDDFWCRWMGGGDGWWKNPFYRQYLSDVLAKTPRYRVNALVLMGEFNKNEANNLIDDPANELLPRTDRAEIEARADEKRQAIAELVKDAEKVGVGLYLSAYELQLPKNFVQLHPDARGTGAPICLSDASVWKYLAEKYDELFQRVPGVSGVVLKPGQGAIDLLKAPACQCDECTAMARGDLLKKVVVTVRDACAKREKQVIVRTYGADWAELHAVRGVLASIAPFDSITIQEPMSPFSSGSLTLPAPEPVGELQGRRVVREGSAAGEAFGKSDGLVLPAEYYRRHFERAAAEGARGVVMRIDAERLKRSLFETPHEMNVWLTSRLEWEPGASLDDLWLRWVAARYGADAAAPVAAALRSTEGVWERGTALSGFPFIAANGSLAPFFRGRGNAYAALSEEGPRLAHSSPELTATLEALLKPDAPAREAALKERDAAVADAQAAVETVERAKPKLAPAGYDELSHYLRLQLASAKMWREVTDLYFSSATLLQGEGLPEELLQQTTEATERTLKQGRALEQEFGPGHWPVAPNSPRGLRLEAAVAEVWGEILDRFLRFKPKGLGEEVRGTPRVDAQRLYLALLQTAAGQGPREEVIAGSPRVAKLALEGTRLIVEAPGGQRLAMPVGMEIQGPAVSGLGTFRLSTEQVENTVRVHGMSDQAPELASWRQWLRHRVLPPEEAARALSTFLEQELQEPAPPASAAVWDAGKPALQARLLRSLGIEDRLPPDWSLSVQAKGTVRRPGYRVEKLTFQAWPGMHVPALLYVPEEAPGRMPGLVSIAAPGTPDGKANETLQQRHASLALRGCVVLACEPWGTGERIGAPTTSGGQNTIVPEAEVRSFTFSRRTPAGLAFLEARRALDVLSERGDVDDRRLGITGTGTSGETALLLAALDPRVKLAAPIEAVAPAAQWVKGSGEPAWATRSWGVLSAGGVGPLLALHAPNPTVVLGSGPEAAASIGWAQLVYAQAGAAEGLTRGESSPGSAAELSSQLDAAVEKWLAPAGARGREAAPVETVSPADLRCGVPPKSLTHRDIYAQWLAPLPRVPEIEPGDPHAKATAHRAQRAFVRERLGLPVQLPQPMGQQAGRESVGPWTAEYWILQPEAGVRIPGVLIARNDMVGPITLVPGRDEATVARAIANGRRVFAFDPRGTGEEANGGAAWRSWSWLAGRPVTGQWSLDILQAARFLQRQRFPARGNLPEVQVVLDAPDRFGMAGYLAGAAYPKVMEQASVSVPYPSFRLHLAQAGERALADVPGLMELVDVPQLRELWSRARVRRER
jgi:hypothetical protein